MCHDDMSAVVCTAEGDIPLFYARVVRIIDCDREQIPKYASCILEGHPVFCDIRCGFSSIPLELHSNSRLSLHI